MHGCRLPAGCLGSFEISSAPGEEGFEAAGGAEGSEVKAEEEDKKRPREDEEQPESPQPSEAGEGEDGDGDGDEDEAPAQAAPEEDTQST